MRIQNNLMAINTHRQLGVNQANQAKSTEKLSSGYRVNRAGDDAAGLSISEKMRGQIRGLNRASMNAQDGISLIQAAEGALQESHSILQRMRELAVQGANDINATEDRTAIVDEINQLGRELDRIATTTNFNGKYVLSGAYSANLVEANYPEELGEAPSDGGVPLNLQVGANTLGSDVIKVALSGVTASDLLNTADVTLRAEDDNGDKGISADADAVVASAGDDATFFVGDSTELTTYGFQTLIQVIDGKALDGHILPGGADEPKTGIALVSELRSQLGAIQNRLEHTVANLDTIAENMQSAESRIRDVDMAKEMINFTKSNILNQAATAMLAQANQVPQSVLSLIR